MSSRRHREIPWAALDATSLDSASRAKVAATWAARTRQEHLAVGAFALLVTELATEGCDPIVLSLIAKAVSDELRHAEVCRMVAEGLAPETRVPRRLRGVPDVPKHPDASAAERALLHVVEMCCLSETFTGVYLAEMLARARDPAVRGALESLLEDEIDHGRAGWAYLASLGRGAHASALATGLPDMLERTMGWVIARARSEPEPDDPALEAFGYLGNETAAALFTRCLCDVILPGFAELDVDLAPSRRHVADRGWLSAR